jgi:hypothetical protein
VWVGCFFGGFFCSWVLGFIRVLLLFGCLMGACTVLGFGALEGIGCCWVLGFLRVLLGSALWASWVLPLYTPCVLRGALRFFNEIPITYQKKKKSRPLCFQMLYYVLKLNNF